MNPAKYVTEIACQSTKHLRPGTEPGETEEFQGER